MNTMQKFMCQVCNLILYIVFWHYIYMYLLYFLIQGLVLIIQQRTTIPISTVTLQWYAPIHFMLSLVHCCYLVLYQCLILLILSYTSTELSVCLATGCVHVWHVVIIIRLWSFSITIEYRCFIPNNHYTCTSCKRFWTCIFTWRDRSTNNYHCHDYAYHWHQMEDCKYFISTFQ